jgi:hypothetical protein
MECGFNLLRIYPHHSLDIAVQFPSVNFDTEVYTACPDVGFVV